MNTGMFTVTVNFWPTPARYATERDASDALGVYLQSARVGTIAQVFTADHVEVSYSVVRRSPERGVWIDTKTAGGAHAPAEEAEAAPRYRVHRYGMAGVYVGELPGADTEAEAIVIAQEALSTVNAPSFVRVFDSATDDGNGMMARVAEIHDTPAPDDDLNDADILPLLSDHVPGESSHEAELAQHRRDGQLWATHDPDKARALLGATTADQEGNECRRAWLDGIAFGLEHGTTGLRPRMELEEAMPRSFSEIDLMLRGAD